MGMNEGHAVEGIIYAFCKMILSDKPSFSVMHIYPGLPLTMDTDVLVFDNEALQAIIMVCHSNNKDYAHRKIKRTRQEYVEALQLLEARGSVPLTNGFRVINFVFGMPNGWQDGQIDYMKNILSPTIYLPEILDQTTYDSFMLMSMSEFKKVKNNRDKWRSSIYKAIMEESITFPGQQQICDILEEAILSSKMLNKSTLGKDRLEEKEPGRKVDIPVPFSSRFRQGLSLLNVFSQGEIDAIYNLVKKGSTTENALDMIQKHSLVRAMWIGLIHVQPSISSTFYITPRKRQLSSQVDFSEPFESLSLSRIHYILNTLNNYAKNNPEPFQGGLQYLSIGYYSLVVKCTMGLAEKLLSYISQPSDAVYKQLLKVFEEDDVLVPDTVDSLPPKTGFMVCRSVFAAFVSIITGDSKYGGKHGYGFTDSNCLSANELKTGLGLIISKSEEAIKELHQITQMCDVFINNNFGRIVQWQLRETRPKTFDIQVSGSWLQRFYFVIASHAAYNPLMSVLYSEIVLPRHNGCMIYGFPIKLAETLKTPFPGCDSPGKYRIIVKEANDIVHIYEALSITENNIGNKSKELFDRIGATKFWGKKNKVKVVFHGLFDGDFSAKTMKEFTEIGRYDEFISVRDWLKQDA